MLGAIGALGAGDLRALYAANLTLLRRLALYQVERQAAVVVDQYVASVVPAAAAVTYNRFGLIEGVPSAQPAIDLSAARPQATAAPTGYTPAQVAQAYGFNHTGMTGAGQTIAVITAYNSPTIARDLAAFDRTFGLPDPSLQIVNPKGRPPAGPSNAGWALETALDVEWAHATAPQAKILVMEAGAATMTDLTSAIDYARHQPGVSVVSLSFGSGEFPQELRYDSVLTTPPGHAGITFVAASGDSGAGSLWPAASPNVLSVGGTVLFTGPGGTYAGEVGWPGSGGGPSVFEAEPAYQTGVQLTGRRTTPDVAYDAAPQTGVAVYHDGTWQTLGGTSAGAPQWAGLIALADQQRAQHGLGPLNQAQARLYNLPSADFHDVVFGSNGYLAGVGYDLVTGLGSPVANRLISGLASTVTTPSFHLPFSLQPVSIASLLFPPLGGLGWGGFGLHFPGVSIA
jgi:subtilase family serine protease